ncbi:hypothetical protein [Mycoplasma sp. Ms02]|uniref:hypothetical protein n=1 Tax=Mycoplasma sp. Ms02 TaxID=353851 RepID=UPI001C89AD7C|nr:hypothetical protein [Mycoplasma sp. Ms02]QZE12491.1 hypothetical protein K4L35_00665 [Mycoplasma sp. Ms02]
MFTANEISETNFWIDSAGMPYLPWLGKSFEEAEKYIGVSLHADAHIYFFPVSKKRKFKTDINLFYGERSFIEDIETKNFWKVEGVENKKCLKVLRGSYERIDFTPIDQQMLVKTNIIGVLGDLKVLLLDNKVECIYLNPNA